MLCVGPALHSPVAPRAARIISSNTGERGPRANAECGNSFAGRTTVWIMDRPSDGGFSTTYSMLLIFSRPYGAELPLI